MRRTLLREGVELEDGPVKADKFRVRDVLGDISAVEITLHEGRNHVVHMMDAVGFPVRELVRIGFGPIHLDRLQPRGMRRIKGDGCARLVRFRSTVMALIQRAEVVTTGPVLIIGTGLIGTSIALALRGSGVAVYLWDASPTSLALAGDMGLALRSAGDFSRLQTCLTDQVLWLSPLLRTSREGSSGPASRHSRGQLLPDVASVKEAVVGDVFASSTDLADEGEITATEYPGLTGSDLARYVGSHPMAGRARSGASHADGDLFIVRPWVIVPTEHSS